MNKDLRHITTAFGELDAETRLRLMSSSGPWEYLRNPKSAKHEWVTLYDPEWRKSRIYRLHADAKHEDVDGPFKHNEAPQAPI